MNDNLKTESSKMERRSYRVNDSTPEVVALKKHNLYKNDAPYEEMDEADDDSAYEIVMVDSNTYVSNIHIPADKNMPHRVNMWNILKSPYTVAKEGAQLIYSSGHSANQIAHRQFFGKIIGEKGETVYRITRDTKTNIKIPLYGESNEVSIFGPSISNVKGALRRINIIVMSARMKQRPTHFISVPMNGPHIVESFNKFKAQVLQECNVIEESLFNKSSKLHITLGVMSLMDNEEQLIASKLLTEAKDKCIMPLIEDHLPLKIRLKGLSFMNDDPSAINVLYGCVEEVDAPSGLLQKVVDEVLKHFNKSGLMNDKHERESVKMHVTLLNSKYRARQEQTEGTAKKCKTFDGSEVLSKFSDYDFGIMELTNIHLSQCNTMGPDGYYQSTCVISCNNNEY